MRVLLRSNYFNYGIRWERRGFNVTEGSVSLGRSFGLGVGGRVGGSVLDFQWYGSHSCPRLVPGWLPSSVSSVGPPLYLDLLSPSSVDGESLVVPRHRPVGER